MGGTSDPCGFDDRCDDYFNLRGTFLGGLSTTRPRLIRLGAMAIDAYMGGEEHVRERIGWARDDMYNNGMRMNPAEGHFRYYLE